MLVYRGAGASMNSISSYTSWWYCPRFYMRSPHSLTFLLCRAGLLFLVWTFPQTSRTAPLLLHAFIESADGGSIQPTISFRPETILASVHRPPEHILASTNSSYHPIFDQHCRRHRPPLLSFVSTSQHSLRSRMDQSLFPRICIRGQSYAHRSNEYRFQSTSLVLDTAQ